MAKKLILINILFLLFFGGMFLEIVHIVSLCPVWRAAGLISKPVHIFTRYENDSYLLPFYNNRYSKLFFNKMKIELPSLYRLRFIILSLLSVNPDREKSLILIKENLRK